MPFSSEMQRVCLFQNFGYGSIVRSDVKIDVVDFRPFQHARLYRSNQMKYVAQLCNIVVLDVAAVQPIIRAF